MSRPLMSTFSDYTAKVRAAQNNDGVSTRAVSHKYGSGLFMQDFAVSPPGLAGLNRLSGQLNALQKSGMIGPWSLGRWATGDKKSHEILFRSERELDAARLAVRS